MVSVFRALDRRLACEKYDIAPTIGLVTGTSASISLPAVLRRPLPLVAVIAVGTELNKRSVDRFDAGACERSGGRSCHLDGRDELGL